MASIPTRTFTDRHGQQLVLRTAHPDDAEAMLAYVRGVVEETDFFVIDTDELPPTVEEERIWIQDHLDHPGKILLLAEMQSCIIGNVRLESGPYRRIAHRGNLSMAVVKEWRCRGVGSALLRAILEWAELSSFIEKVCLEVCATNSAAIGLYEKLGFIEEGRRGKDIKRGPDDYVDTVMMHRFVKSGAHANGSLG
jgi:RimJ/RimL family protein N-acetyltransferase